MFLKIAIVAVLGSTTLISCKKSDLVEARETSLTKPKQDQAIIIELKTFMAKITQKDIKEISYDPNTEYFIWMGVHQIKKEQLELVYEQSKNTESN